MPVRHVLVVDDSKSARLMLRKMLQGFGLTVDTVDSAEEALSYLRGRRPDAIFMDHTMPGLDGLAAVRRIRRDPALATIPVTMYTSKDEPAYQEEARAAGAAGVLVKPATPDALGAALNAMNELFDEAEAAMLAAAAAPPPLALAAPVGEAATTEQLERIAAEKAELVVYDAIESQVLPLINDVIAKLRRELETGQEDVCGRIAVRVCEAQFAKWQPPGPDVRETRSAAEAAVRSQLPALFDERFQALQRDGLAEAERLARDAAAQACQNQFHELSERLARQMSARFTETTQNAVETAREEALQAARQAALRVVAEDAGARAADASPAAVAEQVFERLWAGARRDVQRRIVVAAGWAAAIGVVAAVLAYALR